MINDKVTNLDECIDIIWLNSIIGNAAFNGSLTMLILRFKPLPYR